MKGINLIISEKYTKAVLFVFFLSFLFNLNGQVQIGMDINGTAEENFLGSIIAISDDGSIIATNKANPDFINEDTDTIVVFQNINGSWIQLGEDIISGITDDDFGTALSMSSDGYTKAVVAHDGDVGFPNSGTVKIYQYQQSQWQQKGSSITGSVSNQRLGYAVSLSSDGLSIAIGSINPKSISVYNYTSDWNQLGSDVTSTTISGLEVQLSGDGSRFIAGNSGSSQNGTNTGSASVFEYVSGNWTQVGQDLIGESQWDDFGASTSISYDGSIIAIGGPSYDINTFNEGQAKIYEFDGSVWAQMGSTIYGTSKRELLGNSVSLTNDGRKIIIGSPFNGYYVPSYGYSTLYEYTGTDWIAYGDTIHGELYLDECGTSVAFSGDGSTVIVAAPENDEQALQSGQLRAFDLSDVCSSIVSSNIDGVSGSLRSILECSAHGENIYFNNALLNDTLTFNSSLGPIVILDTVNMNNTGSSLYIDASLVTRPFEIANTGKLSIDNFVIGQGVSTPSVFLNNGELILNNTTLIKTSTNNNSPIENLGNLIIINNVNIE